MCGVTLTNSADLFQSESVLYHIVINQYFAILHTPLQDGSAKSSTA